MAERGSRTQFAVAGWLFGSVSVVLGLAIHAVSGHPVPAPPIAVATAALLSLAGAVVTRIGVPNWALLVLAGVGQQTVHWAFAFFSNPWPPPPGWPRTCSRSAVHRPRPAAGRRANPAAARVAVRTRCGGAADISAGSAAENIGPEAVQPGCRGVPQIGQAEGVLDAGQQAVVVVRGSVWSPRFRDRRRGFRSRRRWPGTRARGDPGNAVGNGPVPHSKPCEGGHCRPGSSMKESWELFGGAP
jgi:hypothetical protein